MKAPEMPRTPVLCTNCDGGVEIGKCVEMEERKMNG